MPHTPGPWGIGISISNLGFVEVRDRDGLGKNTLASVGGNCLSHHAGSAVMPAESIDNARLIAAAPDLLAACKALHSILIQFTEYQKGEWCAAAVAAIAKAEGKS